MCGRGYVRKMLKLASIEKKPQSRQFADKFIITEIEFP